MRDGHICLELQGTLPPGQDGPPLHVHYKEVEEGTVVAGTLAAIVDGRRIQVEAGETACFPAGSAHRWWNGGDRMLAFEGVAKPLVDLDLYFQAVFDVVNSGPARRPPLFYMAHVAWRHRKTQAALLAPVWLQALLVPAIVLLGTVLRRYRGTDWPGCPDRCIPPPLFAEATATPSQPAAAGVA
jgi:hypothetical protein